MLRTVTVTSCYCNTLLHLRGRAGGSAYVGALFGYEFERGRLVAVSLMIVGISVFGVVTALFANWFMRSDQP